MKIKGNNDLITPQKERLSKRNTETEENLQKRLQAATEEINFGKPDG